jgi:hypothetical protein
VIRDLQIRLKADGRNYVIEVCATGVNSAPVSAGPFDVHITVGVAEILPEWRTVEPERVVRHVADYGVALIPKSVPREQWTKFADVVLAWVCEHRRTAQC